MRVNETDNDQVICANIQKRIKSRTWSAQLSQFFFFKLPCLKCSHWSLHQTYKKWHIWVMIFKEKKKFLYYEKYHLFILSAVTHYNYILKNSYETKVMNRLFNMI